MNAPLSSDKRLLEAAREVVEAYVSRFENSHEILFGPIDFEIRELRAAVLEVEKGA